MTETVGQILAILFWAALAYVIVVPIIQFVG